MGDAKSALEGGLVDSAVGRLNGQKPCFPLGGIHDVPCGHRKEDTMESSEPVIPCLKETILEIASILGEGYLRYLRGRRLPTSNPDMAGHVAHSQQFENITEKPLDCSANISVHS